MASNVNNLMRPQMKLLKKVLLQIASEVWFSYFRRKQTFQKFVIIATLHEPYLGTWSSIQAQAAVTGSMLAWSLWLGSLKPRTVVAEEGREGNSCPGPDQPQIIGTNSVTCHVSHHRSSMLYWWSSLQASVPSLDGDNLFMHKMMYWYKCDEALIFNKN